MDENEQALVIEINRLRRTMELNISNLLSLRGYAKNAQPADGSGIRLWEALPKEEKEGYERASSGTGMPGAGLFFSGYRKTVS